MLVLFIAFSVFSAIQFFFHLVAIIKIKSFTLRKHVLDIEDKPVSVIICAHNELKNLKNLIDKLTGQAYGNYEIVVVDDRSEDETFDFLKEAGKKIKNLKMVRIDWTPAHVNEKKYALTLGIKKASNDLLLFTDADCEPVSIHWIKTMVNQFDHKTDFVLGFSYYKKYPGLLNLFIRHETLQTALTYFTLALLGIPYMGVGRNLAYKKSFFLKKNGFDKILNIVGGDDDLFVNRHANGKNTQVAIHPDAVMISEPERSLGNYRTQKIRHLSAGKKYKKKHIGILGLLAGSKLMCWLLGLSLIILSYRLYWTLGIFFAVLFLIMISFIVISRKFGVKYKYGWVWIIDFVYISYLVVFSLAASFRKRIKWI